MGKEKAKITTMLKVTKKILDNSKLHHFDDNKMTFSNFFSI